MRAVGLACGLLLLVAGVSNALPQYSGVSGSQTGSQQAQVGGYWWQDKGIFEVQGASGVPVGVGQPPITPTQSEECPLNHACIPFEQCLQGVFASVVQQGRKRSVPTPNAASQQCGQEGNVCCPIPEAVQQAQQEAVAGPGGVPQQPLPQVVVEATSTDILSNQCGDYEECVPSFQCTGDGTINTSGAGLIDVRIKPRGCTNPEYPNVPAVCCRKPGSCPRTHVCVAKGQCKSDGSINTSGIGLIDVRIQHTCDLEGSYEKGICCRPPQPTPLVTCPEYHTCQPEGQCATKTALNADGSYVTCDLNANYDKGVCCLPKPAPLTTCPVHHTCQPESQCTTQIATNADGLYSTCYLDGSSGVEGVCCERIPPLVTCPATHVCVLDGQCGTQVATNVDGSYTSCYIEGVQGGQEGTCCERYPAVQTCRDNFSCQPAGQCGTQVDFHPDLTVMNCYFGDGSGEGTCCENYPPVATCPDNLVCQVDSVCNSLGATHPDGSQLTCYADTGVVGLCCEPPPLDTCPLNLVCADHCDVASGDSAVGTYDKCYKADGSGNVGTCCQPPIKVLDVCPGASVCTPEFQCLGDVLYADGHFTSQAAGGALSYCPLGDGSNGVCCQHYEKCGVRKLPIDTRIQGPLNEAIFAEFPWMGIMFYSNYTYKCGASLISNTQLVTGAHCAAGLNPADIKVRLGEHKVNAYDEPLKYVDVDIKEIIVHPNFNPQTLFNDIAVLTLTEPVFFQEHIQTLCLPSHQQQYLGKNCIATGWGKDAFHGSFQTTLKKVDLPFVDHASCNDILKTTRLGQYFVLDKSFLCAGDKGRDACTGDGGGPLICPQDDGSYVLAGITAWGIGCGEVPGVYADVAYLQPWLDSVLGGGNQQQQQQTGGSYGK